jgi:hypothetical protein
LIQENWLDAGRFKALPAVWQWSDFDDRHNSGPFAFTCKAAYMFTRT